MPVRCGTLDHAVNRLLDLFAAVCGQRDGLACLSFGSIGELLERGDIARLCFDNGLLGEYLREGALLRIGLVNFGEFAPISFRERD